MFLSARESLLSYSLYFNFIFIYRFIFSRVALTPLYYTNYFAKLKTALYLLSAFLIVYYGEGVEV